MLAVSVGMISACSVGEPARPGSSELGVSGGGVAGGGGGAPKLAGACDLSATVSASAVKTCLTQGGDPSACLEAVFRPYLKDQPTTKALAFLQCLEEADDTIRVACHPVAHAIGRETFAVQGSVDGSFQACDATCHSGCYHGAMERFLRGESDANDHISFGELQAKVATACNKSLPLLLRFQCLHGLGHAVTYYTAYDLKVALTLCDATGDDWDAASCWGGVFMENLVAATPERRAVSPTDYHYPCTILDEKYRGSCYAMQTSRMTEMGLTAPQIFAECKNAGTHELTCVESLGRDLSNTARAGDPRAVSSTCELGVGDRIDACTRGVIHALADNSWDGRYAFPFCKTFVGAGSVAYCYATTVEYLQAVYQRTTDQLAQECAQYAPGVQACLTALGR